MTEQLSFKQSELTLFRGTRHEEGVLVLVAKDRMAISTDFGDEDPWVLKKRTEVGYYYRPLDLTQFKNLTQIW